MKQTRNNTSFSMEGSNPSIRLEGWLWKNPPTIRDKDKNSFRRFLRTVLQKDSTAYQKRWFVLREGIHPFQKDILWYYAHKPPYNHQPHAKGSIEVDIITKIVRTESFSGGVDDRGSDRSRSSSTGGRNRASSMVGKANFQLICEKRTYYLGANSEEEMNQWIEAIETARQADDLLRQDVCMCSQVFGDEWVEHSELCIRHCAKLLKAESESDCA